MVFKNVFITRTQDILICCIIVVLAFLMETDLRAMREIKLLFLSFSLWKLSSLLTHLFTPYCSNVNGFMELSGMYCMCVCIVYVCVFVLQGPEPQPAAC